MAVLQLQIDPPHAEIVLDDPDRRNALGLEMFDALNDAVTRVSDRDDLVTLLLRGSGRSFCAGFDLGASVEDPKVLAELIRRLGGAVTALRRLPMVVVAAVQGHALAGGCALLTGCDMVVVAPDAELGYPVHHIGVSPAVTLPTLLPKMGGGAARALALGGDVIDGAEARRLGLASHLATSGETVLAEARGLCETLSAKGHHALRVTKAWLNELEGSLDESGRAGAIADSAAASQTPEAVAMLRAFWERRSKR